MDPLILEGSTLRHKTMIAKISVQNADFRLVKLPSSYNISYFCSKMSRLPAETSDDLDILARRDAEKKTKGIIYIYHISSGNS